MSVKQHTTLSGPGIVSAIREIEKELAARETALKSVSNAAGVTLTAAQMVNTVITRAGAAAVSDTTATAALIVAAIRNCQVGASFDMTIINTNSDTLTIVAGSGVTLAGVTTVAADKARRYRGVVTAVGTPAVTLQGVMVGDK